MTIEVVPLLNPTLRSFGRELLEAALAVLCYVADTDAHNGGYDYCRKL